jgi:hypothetical protein
MPAMPRSDRGPNARKATTVLLDDDEKTEMQEALDEENAERGQDLGLGSKLRELGLLWARGRKKTARAKPPRSR